VTCTLSSGYRYYHHSHHKFRFFFPVFTAGLDVKESGLLVPGSDPARKSLHLRQLILHYQDSVSAIESCDKPVIAALNGYVIGGGIDIASACDIRYASADAVFSIKVRFAPSLFFPDFC
jgi:enoyl-CoA hydratase/carnithine racemase